VIISTRKKNCAENELNIVQPIVEKLNEQWFEKGEFIWIGRFDDENTSMLSLKQQ
jgi:hypothetical protein